MKYIVDPARRSTMQAIQAVRQTDKVGSVRQELKNATRERPDWFMIEAVK